MKKNAITLVVLVTLALGLGAGGAGGIEGLEDILAQFFGGGGTGCPHAYEGIYWAQSDCREGLG